MRNTVIAEDDDIFDIRSFLTEIWNSKVLIIIISLLCALGSVFYALSLPNQYKVSVVLSPVKHSANMLSGSLNQLGGLASLAGMRIGSADSNESQIAQKVMKSWSFVDKFINSNDIAVELFAANGWDKKSNTLKMDDDIYDSEKNSWVLDRDKNVFKSPSSWTLFQSFQKRLSIIENKRSGLVEVSFEYYSPEKAKQWLDLFIVSINKHMQERKVARLENNIEYLLAQIEKTSITEMREVFYTIVEEQIKSKMLAEASPEYAFLTVSPSMIPEQKFSPNRAFICVFSTLIGITFSLVIVFLRFVLMGKRGK